MNIKDLFDKAENGTLTYEQFEALVKENGLKFADLSDGKYVSKSKYEADLKAVNQQVETLTTQITDLNGTITTRDADLEVQSGHHEDYTIHGLRFAGGHGTQMDGYSQAYLSGAEQARYMLLDMKKEGK